MELFDFMTLRNFVLLAVLYGVCALAASVEAQTTAEERPNRLREQLVEVLAQQEGLEVRLLELEEALKPDNIEKNLAGIGSTRPEELRELRRRQLDLERTSLQKQLKQLADSRTRLEEGIIQADAAAYHQSATGNLVNDKSGPQQQIDTAQSVQRPRRSRQSKPRLRRTRRSMQ
jgi:hypothetical protein